ncbi:hypothetical protein DL769_009288 [Monosporascus sp. CRB-8-3]|nr:hypothetical protein DL769_009288 [Monosporascus sp. CRB-8-3]
MDSRQRAVGRRFEDGELWQIHKDGMRHVYNYAAQYGWVPSLERVRQQDDCAMTIHLPELNIHVTGHGTSFKFAQIAAVIEFKKEAERNISKLQARSTVIETYGLCLNTSNARAFWDFYRDTRGCFPILRSEHRGSFTALVLTIGDRLLADILAVGKKPSKEALAYLAGAVQLTRTEPELLRRFADSSKPGANASLKSIPLQELSLAPAILHRLQESVSQAENCGLRELRPPPLTVGEEEFDDAPQFRRPWSEHDARARSMALSSAYKKFLQSPKMQIMRNKRAQLPIVQHRREILDIVAQGTYSIVVGATGSGKTTQVPQLLLEQAVEAGNGGRCRIICTQPRRIAAISVSQRIAEERGECIGETVGYHVRGDAKLARPGGSITFCTTGLLLRQLKSDAGHIFDTVSHILIDEVHERDMFVDFLLVILKTTVTKRKQDRQRVPKIVLMSATMDTNLFAEYFKQEKANGTLGPCPSISIPGRLFPVRHQYLDETIAAVMRSHDASKYSALLNEPMTKKYLSLEKKFGLSSQNGTSQKTTESLDWERLTTPTPDRMFEEDYDDNGALFPLGLVALTIAHVVKTTEDGSVLVFLPGVQEIVKTRSSLLKCPLGVELTSAARFKITALHSNTPQEEQTEIFKPLPKGCRRIILATNIAETSLTIPDVQHVIDSGKLREKQYGHARGIEGLLCTWVSKANCKQRAGRAGRVRDGNYYALFTEERFKSFRVAQLAELRRSDLQTVCLGIKSHGFQMSIKDFLSAAIDPPSPLAIDAAISRLKALGALSQNEISQDGESLTPLGRVLSVFTIEPSLAKMVIMGAIFRCLDPMIILAAILDSRPLFLRPPDRKMESLATQHEFMDDTHSEHITKLNAFKRLQQYKRTQSLGVAWTWAKKNFVSMSAYTDIERSCNSIEESMIRSGIIPDLTTAERTDQEAVFGTQYGDVILNENSHDLSLIRALLLSGLAHNLAISYQGRKFRTMREEKLAMSFGSIFSETKSTVDYRGAIFIASSLAKGDSNQLMLRDVTEVTPLMTTIFGGSFMRLQSDAADYRIGGWLPFQVRTMGRKAPEAIIPIAELRVALDKILHVTFQTLPEHRQSNAQGYLADSPLHRTVIKGVVDLLRSDPTDMKMKLTFKFKGDAPSKPLNGSPLVNNAAVYWGGNMLDMTWVPEYYAENRSRIKHEISEASRAHFHAQIKAICRSGI